MNSINSKRMLRGLLRGAAPFLSVLLVLGLVFTARPATALCREGVVELRGDWGQARFRVALADEPSERARGLMHVEAMQIMEGMLFAYERPQAVSFWMENTLIPLDMIFAGPDGVVRHIHDNAVPLDRTPIPGGADDIQYVLEINGGLAAQLGISPGTALRHPIIDPVIAAWPCD